MDILRPNSDLSTMDVIELIPMRPITTINLTAGVNMSYYGIAHAGSSLNNKISKMHRRRHAEWVRGDKP
jgi:hypothetical protein